MPRQTPLPHQLLGRPFRLAEAMRAGVSPEVLRGRRVGGVSIHRGSGDAVRRDGRLLSTPAENFLELAETLTLVDLVILGDAMVRQGLVTCEELVRAVASTTRRRGIRTARLAAAPNPSCSPDSVGGSSS